MGKLVLHLPDGATRDIPLARERMTIGRRADNDICLPLPTVSAEHAAVVTVLDDSFLEDLGSRNGTLVNGKEIKKHFLRDHDEIDIGRQRLVYYSGVFEATEASPTPATATDRRAPEARAHFAGDPATDSGAPERQASTPAMIDTSALFAEPDDPPAGEQKARTDAPTIEIVDGPGAGTQVVVDRDDFVVGRVGVQIAAIRRTADGYRLVLLEGEVPPSINGAALPREGALLALGDEVEIAGTRLRYHPS
jgi:pSer/pThr/pTyr-binding forkhead associated (FHA) protein